jgi:GNAT superfamily N-acetyltransferase
MGFVIEPRAFDHPDAVGLVRAIQEMYEHLYGGHDDDATEATQFTPPDGLFLVGYLDGGAVASGGWRHHDATSVEIKRMFVAKEVRGRGLARRMLAELERTAAGAGANRIVLNTGFRQRSAMRFYEANGYTRTDDRFGHYEGIRGAHFYVKTLRADR